MSFRSPFGPQMQGPYAPMRGGSPISIPKMPRNPLQGAPLKKGANFKQMLSTTERGIDTINQVIPIYQKVKPLIQNGREMTKGITNLLFKKKETPKKENVEKVEAEIVEKEPVKAAAAEPKKDFHEEFYRDETKPNAPFF